MQATSRENASTMKTPAPTLASLRRMTALSALCALLAACGGGDDDAAVSAQAPAPAAASPNAPAPTPAPAPVPDPGLRGVLVGPVGTPVTLQNNGADSLSLAIAHAAPSSANYAQTAFAFPTPSPDGTPYAVSVASAPANQTCRPYAGASGVTPVPPRTVRVGCEFIFDHLVRSSDDSVVGGFDGSQSPVLGGSNVPIGATTQAFGEGRAAVFVSDVAGLAPGATGAFRQVFWRDRLTGETLLVSASPTGAPGNGGSAQPALSADGLTVAFESTASNLVEGDTNGVSDIFVWSALNPSAGVQRVSLGLAGAESNATSNRPSLSGDGRIVAFTSGATNLTAGENGGTNSIRVYRRDLASSVNTLVSRTAANASQEGANPVLSEDGNRLAFSTFWPLLASDTNNLWDIYVYDHGTGGLKRVSLTSTGGERDQGTESASRVVAPAISGDGQYVAYATTATNVVPGDTNGAQDVFVVNVDTGSVLRASVSSTGAQASDNSPIGQGERPGLSFDGKWVAFTTIAPDLAGTTNVVLRNWETGETLAMTPVAAASGAARAGPVSLTRSAAYVAFFAGTPLDAKFATSSGLFARFTGLQRAFSWRED